MLSSGSEQAGNSTDLSVANQCNDHEHSANMAIALIDLKFAKYHTRNYSLLLNGYRTKR